MNTLIFWFIFFVVTILLELSSPGLFFFLSFSAGAVAAALMSWLQVGPYGEFAVFAVISAAAFIVLKNYVHKQTKGSLHQTNVHALIGKRGLVTESLSSCKKGWVKVEGELWAALPAHETQIEQGALVEVVSLAGSHLIVKKMLDQQC